MVISVWFIRAVWQHLAFVWPWILAGLRGVVGDLIKATS